MYDHKTIEKKWQNYWKTHQTFKVPNPPLTPPSNTGGEQEPKPGYYCLDMFPYPSGAGLHVGHPEGFTANDIVARYKHACGYNVLHPMGWDAFGLPAENYAIKTGTHPRITTDQNIATFKKQLQALGFSYDWNREIDTTDPNYYKWTQWIFLKLFEQGLAYEQDLPINYCPSCKTGLANEEVLNDFTCERCGAKVEKKKIRQWVLAITKYAERLLQDVDKLDWPESIKDMQRNWIGKSEGCEFEMKVAQKKGELPLHNVGGLNVRAKFSSTGSIFENILKVKKKNKKVKLESINSIVNNEIGEVIFNGLNLGKHFSYKNVRELHLRKNIGNIVQKSISRIIFDNGIGYFAYNSNIVKVILGKQSNGKYFVKTYYKDEKLSALYQCHLEEQKQQNLSIRVYTTRIDTVFGMTYAVLAPDHSKIQNFITPEQKPECDRYIETAAKKSDQDRTQDDKEKTGVFTGSYVINPFNNEEVPLWIGDYVLGNYGTGAVMAVPAHDERDFAFAKKYDLPIRQSVATKYTLEGNLKMRPEVESIFRRTATAIIEHNNKFLVLKEHESKDIGFPGGGIKQHESLEDAVKREVLEETGYKNINIERIILDHIFCEGYRVTKKVNQTSNDTFFHVTLKNEERDEISEKEKSQHDVQWIEKEEIEKNLSWPQHKYIWKLFLNPQSFNDHGILVNSGDFDGLTSKEAQEKLTAYAGEKGCGEKKVNYKLRDWLFSRQRYWGEPIPIVHCPDCGIVGEKEENLPILLPDTDNFEPSGDGTSPLSQIESFVHCQCPKCGGPAKRETNTMPQWGGSCWYYLRFMDPTNPDKLVDPEIEKYWGQVDSYVGGAEHAVLHLLYARFWHKFLFDIGVVSHDEPFYRLRNQGLILAHAYQRKNGGLVACDLIEEKNGKYYEIETEEEVDRIISKMSKSLKNVINPDDIVEEYGADSLRLYEMYMAEFKDSAPWDTKGIIGVRRFLDKVERLFPHPNPLLHSNFEDSRASTPVSVILGEEREQNPPSPYKGEGVGGGGVKISKESDDMTMKLLHKTIKKVQEDIENYKFNTAIAQMMILVNNGLPQDDNKQQEWKQTLLVLLHPFAPHLAEELWEILHTPLPTSPLTGERSLSIFFAPWPLYDPKLVVDDTVTIGVQVLGKLRGEIEIAPDEPQASVLEKAKANENVAKWLEGKELVKEIYVPGKIVNLVVK